MLRLSDSHLSLEVTGSADAAGRGGPVGRSETEQGLKGGHGLSPAIVTKDELLQVDGKLGAADAVVGADQPLLKVADGAVGQRHDRWDASTQVTAQGLRRGETRPRQVRRRTSDHPYRRSSPVPRCVRNRVRVVALKLGMTPMRTRPEPRPRRSTATSTSAFSWRLPRSPGCGPPGVVDLDSPCSGSRAALTMARRSLWSISHAVSLRLSPSWRCSPTAEIVRRHQIRRPEPLGQQFGVVEDGPRGQRDLVSAGVFGGELALKLGQTRGSWAGHTPTLHIGVCETTGEPEDI